ncbi:dicarboxylate/amino acid:cation symporter [uncultured Porphyromonas sp.]|jgi:Na+/H+-dicarboxylate symporters|uniref:dicarboxylate/amino acid:cation symporter n=1 Tax=uncultured Porphyromonas sp. TaxID=159274 RepID=UPI002635FCCB|nr:dicarboxylate/amino acid:cation symporter [uncultured Porphyromonas sp.]
MKRIKISLLGRIVIAILLGLALGRLMPLLLPEVASTLVARLFLTFNAIFSQFLGFMIPLIILALVAEAIGSIGNKAGKILLLTVGIAYGSTVFSGYLAYLTGSAIFPQLIQGGGLTPSVEKAEALTPFFTVEMPPVMGVMTALILAFILGLGAAKIHSRSLMAVIIDVKEIISYFIAQVIIPLLPLYIFGVFLGMASNDEVLDTLLIFAKVIGVIFVLHIFLLLLQFTLAGLISRKNPLRLLTNMLPAYFTALGTASSAATIPVTLAQTKKNGVSDEVSSFVIPLCATIHLSGSTLKIVSCALALILMTGGPHDIGLFTEFILMLGITMVAAPGVPGGAIMAALAILSSILGFNEVQLSLMISLYIAMDSFGTACNVTGDGAIAVVVDTFTARNRKE